ncbi:MAG TPA: hypothetical protein VF701_20230 [Thermoanaerobaculia bacterium]
MMEQNRDVSPEERRAALDRIAEHCAEALLVVQQKVRRLEPCEHVSWSSESLDRDARQRLN